MVLKSVEHLVVKRQLVVAVKQAATLGSSTCDVPLGNFTSFNYKTSLYLFLLGSIISCIKNCAHDGSLN